MRPWSDVVTSAELMCVKRHKFTDAHRRPASHPLHTVRQPVIPTRPVQLAHCHHMTGKVLGQSKRFQPPFPVLDGSVSVSNVTVQGVRKFPRDLVHVL
jgi:hypothetical protein